MVFQTFEALLKNRFWLRADTSSKLIQLPLIFQTEKQLKEFGDKLSADKKSAIETAVAELKTAFEAKDAEATKTKTEALDAAWMAASEELYKATQEAQPQPEQTQGNAGENVQDADFEEVK